MKLLLRADASVRIGTGHIMRCLALAQAWQDAGGVCVFAAAQLPAALRDRLLSEGFRVEGGQVEPGSHDDATWTAEVAVWAGARWVVLDGYVFDAGFQQRLKEGGRSVLVIDDYGHAGRYVADLVVNQNQYARDNLYTAREPSTELLLGTRFALLRREFRKWRGWERPLPDVAHKVLVTLGGSDPDNVTLTVVRALREGPPAGFEAAVVVGGANPHWADLRSEVAGTGDRVQLLTNVIDMPGLMAWADLGVAASGSTSWELAFFGLPTCCVILADNQAPVAEGLHAEGAMVNLGRGAALTSAAVAEALLALAHDPAKRRAMGRRLRALVDGEGCRRVVDAILASGAW
jgi:UDP-2,4-diacetamido-2,4,6-trideoxy-beta-L-altropyranose hydrolase